MITDYKVLDEGQRELLHKTESLFKSWWPLILHTMHIGHMLLVLSSSPLLGSILGFNDRHTLELRATVGEAGDRVVYVLATVH